MTPDNPLYYDPEFDGSGRRIEPFYGPKCANCTEPSAPHMREIDGVWFHEECYELLPLCTDAGCDKRILGEVVFDAECDPWHPVCKRESESQ